jgi:hypothetical protein
VGLDPTPARDAGGALLSVTLVCCRPVVFVAFQQRSGQWLDASVIEELVMLARSGCAGRRRQARAQQNQDNEIGRPQPLL